MVDLENRNYVGECSYYTVNEFREVKGLVMVHFNCGILSVEKLADIKVNLVSPNTDILCITESGLGPNDENGTYNIDNFIMYRQDRDFEKCKSSGGGLITYIRDTLSADDRIYSHLNVNEPELECYFIKISRKECKDLIVVNCYRMPDNRTIESRLKAVNFITNNIKSIENFDRKHYVILGDLNYNFCISEEEKNNSNAYNSKDYIDMICNELNLNNIINKSTCFRGESESTIDLILTNINNLYAMGVVDFSNFDHRAVFCSKKRVHDNKEHCHINVRNMKNLDLDHLSFLLNSFNWDSIKHTDIDIYWLNLKNKLIEICNLVCPFKSIKIRKHIPPWYNTELALLRIERDRLGTIARKDKKKIK